MAALVAGGVAAWSVPRSLRTKPAEQASARLDASSEASSAEPSSVPPGPSDAAGSESPLDQTSPKPHLAGVLDRHGAPAPSRLDEVDGFVVDVAWKDIQPEAFGPLATGNPIDQAISFVRDKAPRLGIKLRVKAGIYAPPSVEALGGGAVAVAYDGYDQLTGTVGRFWTDEFGDAYADLQRRLADAYDNAPEVLQVVITRCMTFYAEPLLRQACTPQTPQALLAAGYSVDADHRCQHEAIEAHQAWRRTASSMAFNPYQVIDGGDPRVDTAYSVQVMHDCRDVLGDRCVLENYSLAWPLRTGDAGNYQAIYDGLVAAGPPLSFQTAAASRIGDWAAAIGWAADVGASSVELNRSYPSYDRNTLDELRRRLFANAGR